MRRSNDDTGPRKAENPRGLEHQGEGETEGKVRGFLNPNSTTETVDGRNIRRVVLILIEIGLVPALDKIGSIRITAHPGITQEVLGIMGDGHIPAEFGVLRDVNAGPHAHLNRHKGIDGRHSIMWSTFDFARAIWVKARNIG